jgi:Cu2+-exporting ATPase
MLAAESLETARIKCFHCGLPVADAVPVPPLTVQGEQRRFCCHGCHAVCKAISDAGMVDYYRFRTDPAVSGKQPGLAEFLDRVELYDRPDVQQNFVTANGDWQEAALLLENITCPACLWLNERRLRSLPGVIDVHIDDVMQRARVRWDPARIRLSGILRAIADIGYIAHPYDATRSRRLQQLRRRRSTERLIFAGAAGMLVMHFSLASYFMGGADVSGQLPLWELAGRWTSLLVTFIILAWPGQDFFAGAWHDLRNRRLGMDVPVVLGLSVAWLGSLHSTLNAGGEVYFDSIAMFVFLLLLARRLELRGKLRAADRLDRLARVTPLSARRRDADGAYREVAVEELVVGDCIRLLPGETLAVDGILIDGISSFDESLLTGEAKPVVHRPGDAVIAGTVNGEQPVSIRVTRTLKASTLTEIQQLVRRGLEQRPRYALLAERVAAWFVAVLLLVATGTALFWLQVDPANWLASTIAVLIVTCPCALALATPVSLAVSASRFIDRGVLPLRMRALDALATSDLFAFDKTGTLTAGQPALVAVIPIAGLNRDQCLRFAVALAAHSEHPLARALRQKARRSDNHAEQVENVPGSGIRARIDGREWRFGKTGFAGAVATDKTITSLVEDRRARGQLVSLLANETGVQAVLAFEDPLRAGTHRMLSALADSGVQHFTILSGDQQAAVRWLGGQLGIDDCQGGCSAQEKLAWTRHRQGEGYRVAMIGDGINDAPTLAAADVSISFADATDLANTSSDFVVLGDDATALAAARRLARRTRRNIGQNLAWAATYNLLAIPFAAAGWIPPWGAAIGMSLSSLLVVMNAMRLQRG